MRFGQRARNFVGDLVAPALAAAVVAYFGYYTVFGTRGLIALSDVQARLAVKQEQLASLKSDRARLEHRIQLLQPGAVDPDLVEEIARGQMLGSAPGQVAIPRDRQ